MLLLSDVVSNCIAQMFCLEIILGGNGNTLQCSFVLVG